jgi:hypothetical protein
MAREAKTSTREAAPAGEARGIANRTNPGPEPSPKRGEARRGGGTHDARSRATPRARSITSPGELADVRPGETLATRDHAVIRHWARERDAEPAVGAEGRRGPVLRLGFPGFAGERLEPIAWDEWLAIFDERGLVFLFQEKLKNGAQSDFFRLDVAKRAEG